METTNTRIVHIMFCIESGDYLRLTKHLLSEYLQLEQCWYIIPIILRKHMYMLFKKSALFDMSPNFLELQYSFPMK